MNPVRWYPLFVDLAGKDVLIAGAGPVGRRKLASLLSTPVRSVTLVDPSVDPGSYGPDQARVRLLVRKWSLEDLEGKFLVFAVTSDPAVNRNIANACAARGILCNRADGFETEPAGFYVPSSLHLEQLTVCLGTDGTSPALARKIRKELEGYLGNRYTRFLRFMGRLRPAILELGLPSDENAELFRALVDSPLDRHLREGDLLEAGNELEKLLPASLRKIWEELLHDL